MMLTVERSGEVHDCRFHPCVGACGVVSLCGCVVYRLECIASLVE